MTDSPDKPPITPAEFRRQFTAALAEITAKGSLSLGQRQAYVIRCGEMLGRGQRCLRRRAHAGSHDPRWEG